MESNVLKIRKEKIEIVDGFENILESKNFCLSISRFGIGIFPVSYESEDEIVESLLSMRMNPGENTASIKETAFRKIQALLDVDAEEIVFIAKSHYLENEKIHGYLVNQIFLSE